METSIPWTAAGGGDSGPYSADDWADMDEMLWHGANANGGGVAKGYLNELAATEVAANTVRVATGGGMVKGHKYRNTATVDFTVATPVGSTRVDRLVLRCSWGATQTVRLYQIAGTEGMGVPALTQNDGVTWDFPLWRASITVGGVITLTDERAWLQPSIEVQADNIADGAIDDAHAAGGQFVPIGGIIEWGGAIGSIPASWSLCDGTLGTPDLRGQFIIGAGGAYAVGATGGAATHLHAVSIASDLGGNHNHGGNTGNDAPGGSLFGAGGFAAAVSPHYHSITAAANHQHGVNGNTAAGSTMPPFYALAKIRRMS